MNYSRQMYRAGWLLTTGFPYGIHVYNQFAFVADNNSMNPGVPSRLQVYNISNAMVPENIATLDLLHDPNAVWVSNSVAAVACDSVPLYLFDVSDSANPIPVGFLDEAYSSSDVVIVGAVAFITDKTNGRLVVVDISDPSAPFEYASVTLAGADVHKLTVVGNHAYFANGVYGLAIIDISSLAEPVVASVYQENEYYALDTHVSGGVAYLLYRNSHEPNPYVHFRFLDVTDPSAPIAIGDRLQAGLEHSLFLMAVYENYLFACAAGHHTRMYDVVNPTDPVRLDDITGEVGWMYDMEVFGSYLYEGRSSGGGNYGYGYRITYIASPDPLEPIAGVDTPGEARDVAVEEGRAGLAYVADGGGGLQVVDISNPSDPELIRTVATPGFAEDVELVGSRAYIADGDAGLTIIDVSDPVNIAPTIIGTMDTPGYAKDVAVVDTLAYVADSAEGLRIIRITDPGDLQVIGVQSLLTMAQGVDVVGIYAYVADGLEGLHSLNVSDPSNPWIIDGVKNRDWTDARDVQVLGTKAYVTDTGSGLRIVDVADPGSLQEVGHADTEGEAQHVALVGNFAYVADADAGMQLIHVQDSSNPVLLGNVDVPSSSLGTFATEDFVYVAAAGAGLQVCPAQCGYGETVTAGFSHDGDGSFFPALVHFTNQSTGYAITSHWDFGDGLGFSNAEEPSYYYSLPGKYQVTLTVTGTNNESYMTQEIEVLAKEPRIVSVEDVPEDQGGYVTVRFNRSGYDDTQPGRSELYSIQRQYNDEWVTISTAGAYGADSYAVLAITQGDGAALWSTPFRVIAHMDEGIWIGGAVNGFSLDNIAPAVPGNFKFEAPGIVGWDDPLDQDFQYFSVFGSSQPVLDESALLIGHTVATSMSVAGQDARYFYLTATDDAGNQGDAAVLDALSGTPDGIPTRYALQQCVPNPFNPATTIGFDLPVQARVDLRIYDLSGRLVKAIVAGKVMDPGRHEAVWRGRNSAGQTVAAGVYFYRLESGDFVETKRMTLLK